MNEIVKIQIKTPKETTMPDGLYFGVWGGYIIEVEYNLRKYEMTTKEGVRGMGIKVVVRIKDGVATFEETNH